VERLQDIHITPKLRRPAQHLLPLLLHDIHVEELHLPYHRDPEVCHLLLHMLLLHRQGKRATSEQEREEVQDKSVLHLQHLDLLDRCRHDDSWTGQQLVVSQCHEIPFPDLLQKLLCSYNLLGDKDIPNRSIGHCAVVLLQGYQEQHSQARN
jgi:hypothetical protein